MKKLLLVVIDACASRVLIPAMDSGKLPHLQALAAAGSLNPDCTAIFPSITHAATASIATGCYPQDHGIAGAHWYDAAGNETVHYAGDFWVILNQGIDKFFEGFVVDLNHTWLQADTIFQVVERAGLKAACINHIIFRGDTPHALDVPQLLSVLPGIPSSETIYGPSILCMGDFIRDIPAAASGETVEAAQGLLQRFGFQDDCSVDLFLYLARHQLLPDFTLIYFPDNDDDSHRRGPEAALETLEHVDERLEEIFEAFGGLEAMLEACCVVLTGDHAQSDIATDANTAGIRLDQILADFSLAEAGKPWAGDNDLVACPNLRMAQIYFKQPGLDQLEHVVTKLLDDRRVDQVMWRANLFGQGEQGYHVVTADRGKLHFWPGDDGSQTAVDQQGCAWSWDGDLAAVGGQVSAGTLTFPDYPNAFERIATGLECRTSGQLWTTARPGFEFCLPETSIHTGGGSHGSLHALDSFVPLLMAGAPLDVTLPSHPRSVDVMPLCLTILGLDPPRSVGASHISQSNKE